MYYPQNGYSYPQGYPQQQQTNQNTSQQVWQQNMMQQQQQQIMLQGYPVPDEMTARNAIVSTDGTISIFPDIQNGKIYTKQLDMNTFAPIFKVYQLVQQQTNNSNYVYVEDFQKLQGYVGELEKRIEELKTMIPVPVKVTDKKGVKENVQSNANATK